MQLTTQTTETLVRRFAAASRPELEQCAKELKMMAGDDGQTWRVREAARELAVFVRKQVRCL